MSVPVGDPVHQIEHVQERTTLRSLLLGSAVWFVHLNVIYGLTSVTCRWGWFPDPIAGMPGLRFVQLILTIAAALFLAMVIYLPWLEWRRYQSEKPMHNKHVLHDTEKDHRPLLAFITMLVNIGYLLFVLSSLVPILTLNACALSGSGA